MADQPMPPGLTPPTAPQPIEPIAPRRSWPTVVGVISIVLGALSILGGCWGLATPVVMDVMKDLMPLGQTSELDMVTGHPTLIMVYGGVTLLISILLLVAGIGMVRRRVWSVSASRWWAVLYMLYMVASTAVNAVTQPEMLEQMSRNDPNMAALGTGFTTTIVYVVLVFGLLWGLAYPVFLLIWLSRRAVQDEIASWQSGPAHAPPAGYP